MYDLARSCQELQEKRLIFSTQKRTKMVLVQTIFQEKPRILSRNPRNAKNLVKKSKKCQESCQEIRENPRVSGKKQETIR